MKQTFYTYCIALVFIISSCNTNSGVNLNEEASIQNLRDLTENPLLLNAITTSINPKNNTMSVLYGNIIAYTCARTGNTNYTEGAVLYEVTWQQQNDEQWFGAKIPKSISTIERIEFISTNIPKYTLFQANIHQISNPNFINKRIAWILGQTMSVSP